MGTVDPASEPGCNFSIFLKGWVQPLMHTFTHSFHKRIFSILYEPGSVLGAENTALNKTDNALAPPPFRKLAFKCGPRQLKNSFKIMSESSKNPRGK